MKDGIHPNYREVVFLDTSCDFGFVTRSTVATNETITWKDGKEYPVYKIEISAESHPFYTGKQKTAYEITVRDWSSDVCSSDLVATVERVTKPKSQLVSRNTTSR